MGIRRLALVAALLLHVDQLETGTGAVCRGAEGDLGGPAQRLLSHVKGGASVLMATLHRVIHRRSPSRRKGARKLQGVLLLHPLRKGEHTVKSSLILTSMEKEENPQKMRLS